VSSFRLHFKAIFDRLCATINQDSSLILLYLLINYNHDFIFYFSSRTDHDSLLLPLLEILYGCTQAGSDRRKTYMILVCILILTQDKSFNQNAQQLYIGTVDWFQERFLQNISFCSLIVLILIRTIQKNLNNKLRDEYLHLNCLAAIANMSSYFDAIHPYAAHQLVQLFGMFYKKYLRLHNKKDTLCKQTPWVQQVQSTNHNENTSPPTSTTNGNPFEGMNGDNNNNNNPFASVDNRDNTQSACDASDRNPNPKNSGDPNPVLNTNNNPNQSRNPFGDYAESDDKSLKSVTNKNNVPKSQNPFDDIAASCDNGNTNSTTNSSVNKTTRTNTNSSPDNTNSNIKNSEPKLILLSRENVGKTQNKIKTKTKTETKTNQTDEPTFQNGEATSQNGKSTQKEEQSFEETVMNLDVDIRLIEDFLYAMLEILNSCLSNSLKKNPQISYALLREKKLFAKLATHTKFRPLVINIEAVLSHFQGLLSDQTDVAWTTENILETIDKASRAMLTQEYPLQFTYEEEKTADVFFVPYVWSIVKKGMPDFGWTQ